MRYGELKLVNKRIVTAEGCLFLKEGKDHTKPDRESPLYRIAIEILQKYNYDLPLSTYQEQKRAINKILRAMGSVHDVEHSRKMGVEQEKFVEPYCDRITTHNDRRTFVTILRNAGLAEKKIEKVFLKRLWKQF